MPANEFKGNDQYVRSLDELKCQECGKLLENTGGDWALCPDGHGKLHPKISIAEKMHAFECELKKRPAAKRVKKPKRPYRYTIGRSQKTYRLVAPMGLSRAFRSFKHGVHCTNVTARCPGLKYGYGEFAPAK